MTKYDRPRQFLTRNGAEPVDHVRKDKDLERTHTKREGGNDYYLMHAGPYDAPRKLEVNGANIIKNPAYERWLQAERGGRKP